MEEVAAGAFQAAEAAQPSVAVQGKDRMVEAVWPGLESGAQPSVVIGSECWVGAVAGSEDSEQQAAVRWVQGAAVAGSKESEQWAAVCWVQRAAVAGSAGDWAAGGSAEGAAEVSAEGGAAGSAEGAVVGLAEGVDRRSHV